MKTKRAIGLPLLLTIAVSGVAACASDPNKQLKEAKAEEAEANREQRVEQIDQTKDKRLDTIENRTDQRQESAERLPEGTEQRAKAQADMRAARESFQAEARARIQKANARLVEADRKLQIAGGRAPTSTHDLVNQASRDRAALQAEVDRLADVPNAQWGDEKKRIETRLDQLDSTVDTAASRADDVVP